MAPKNPSARRVDSNSVTIGERLGYTFNDVQLAQQALTHRSKGVPHNERLEFLGDSILNCVIAIALYQTYPKLLEGDLSRIRAHLVKEPTLCALAQELELGNYLLLGEGELKSGGAHRPSILSNALEALIAAIYLDGGFDAAKQAVLRLYERLLNDLDPAVVGKDAKTLLQEYLQSQKLPVPDYAIISTSGQAHQQQFQVECTISKLNVVCQGEGPSRRGAEQEAAKEAYRLITGS